MKPIDLLNDLVEGYYLMPASYNAKVGQAIERLSPEQREILSNLKSSDFNNIRNDWAGLIGEDGAYNNMTMRMMKGI